MRNSTTLQMLYLTTQCTFCFIIRSCLPWMFLYPHGRSTKNWKISWRSLSLWSSIISRQALRIWSHSSWLTGLYLCYRFWIYCCLQHFPFLSFLFTQVIITLHWRWFSVFSFFLSWWLPNWDCLSDWRQDNDTLSCINVVFAKDSEFQTILILILLFCYCI